MLPDRLSRNDRCLRVWGTVYLLLVALLTMAAMYTLVVSVWRGPWRDMWEVMPFIESATAGQATWRDYWEHYGYSHRPLLSRWLWVADFRWFSASNGLLLTISFSMQALVFFAVRAVLRRDGSFPVLQQRVVLAGVVLCLLNITQVFNFLHTFDVQWFLVTGFLVLAIERILADQGKHNPFWLLFSWLCIFIASLNNFSALVMWPVSIFLLVALRFPVWHIALFSLATVLYGMLYFYGLPTGSDSLLQALLKQPWQPVLQGIFGLLVVFPLWYLSNPLSFQLAEEGPLHMPWPVSWAAPVLLSVLLLFALRCWIKGCLQGKKYPALAWMGLSLVLYGYGVAVVTALGRGLFWDNVYALRYQNIVLLFWVGVVLWLASSTRFRHAGLFVGACLLMLVFSIRAGWYHDLLLQTGNRTRDAHLALVVGLENQLSAIQATVSRANLGKDSAYTLEREAGYLRQHQAGPYADSNWQVPAWETIQSSAMCKSQPATVDVRGDNSSYARLSIQFNEPVPYSLIAWFDIAGDVGSHRGNTEPGLLIAIRSDHFSGRLLQSVTGFTDYAGFAKQLPAQKPENIFAREGNTWCRLAQ